MLKLLMLLFLVAVAFGVWGFNQGWFDVNASGDTVKIAFDRKRMDEDLNRLTDSNSSTKSSDSSAAPAKDEKSTTPSKESAPRKDERPQTQPKDNRPGTQPGKLQQAPPSADERAEGMIVDVAREMPQFTVRLKDGRYMTFDLAPKAEIRVNEALSDFRMVRRGSKVVVIYNLQADPSTMAPPRNMAHTILIERGK